MKPKFKLHAWHRLSVGLKIHSAVYSPQDPDSYKRTMQLVKHWMFEYRGGYHRCPWARHALLSWVTAWRCGTTGIPVKYGRFAISCQPSGREKRLLQIARSAGLGVKATRRFLYKMNAWRDCPLTPVFEAKVVKEVNGMDWQASFDFLRRMSGKPLP